MQMMIDVGNVEALQMISDKLQLNKLFERANSMVVQGGMVILARVSKDGNAEKFDEITTQAELEVYRRTVFKYL